jgi:hypothetical protein
MSELTEDERQFLRPRLDELSKYAFWRGPYTVEELIAAWRRFVDEVFDGYSDVFDEYANDLSVRKLLHQLISDAPPGLLVSLRQQLDELDERFRQATVETIATLPGQVGWWYHRKPLRFGDEADPAEWGD